MANFKIVVSDPKSKKAYQKETDQSASGLMGKKIGQKVSGSFLGLQGYELEITGGSDKDGFPMRRDVEGAVRKKVLLSSAPGFHPRIKGQRKRKSVRGNTISADISQVNIKVVNYGKQAIEKLLGAREKEAKKEEAKKEEEKAKEEAKPEEKKEEKPKETEKPEEKPKAEEPKKEEKPREAAEEVKKRPEEKMGIKELEPQAEKKEEKKEQEKAKEKK